MPPQSLEQRLKILEQEMQELRELPGRLDRIELHILQFRGETHDAFSAMGREMKAESTAVRGEMKAESAALREEIKAESAALREEMKAESTAVRGEMKAESAALREEMKAESAAIRTEMKALREELREDIRIGVEESQNLARLLHAEAMQEVAALGTILRRDVVPSLVRLLARPPNSQDPS